MPLNVSREILQNNRILEKIKTSSVKKVLSELAKFSKNDSEKYANFYKEFGKTIKEGLYTDHSNRDAILDLLQFKSLNSDNLTLKDYKEKMVEGQTEIYYITGENEKILRNSPLLEKFKSKNYNVLILDQEVDAIVFPMVHEYDKTPFKSVVEAVFEKGDDNSVHESTIKLFKDVLSDEVSNVRVSKILVEAPVCIVNDPEDQNYMMAKIMKQMGNSENIPEAKPILEINPNNPIIKKIVESSNREAIEDSIKLLMDQARLYNGEQLKDSVEFLARLNRTLLRAF